MSEAFRVKVQRITKPKIVPSDLKSLSFPFAVQPEEKSITSTFVPFYLGNNFFQLNPDFGKMYVGETLRLVISIVNCTNYCIDSANIQVEMITERKDQIETTPSNAMRDVKDSIHLKNIFQQTIRPQDTITFPLEFKVEYTDTYFLCFNIVYKHEQYTQTKEGVKIENVEKLQSKRFKFEAKLPYTLKHRAHRERKTGRVLLEVGLENTAKNTLFFKEINFICTETYNLGSLLTNEEEDLSKLCLNPGEAHHFIFSLELRKDEGSEHPQLKDLENLGQLYTEWYNITNENGKSLSQMITLNIPRHELSLEFVEPITLLTKEIIQAVELTIKNETHAPIDMIFNLVEKEMIGVKIISLSKNELKLAPKQIETIVLFLLPIRLGIYKFGGLKIYNRLAQKELTFNELSGVSIQGEEDTIKFETAPQPQYEESLI